MRWKLTQLVVSDSNTDSSLARQLATITSTKPAVIRRQVLTAMIDAVPAEMGLFYKPIRQGNIYVVGPMTLVGDGAELKRWFRGFADREIPQTLWKPPNVDREGTDRFVCARTLYSDRVLHSYDVWTEVMFPVEVPDNLRALVYEENKLVGWLGLLRRGMSERFHKREEKTLNDAMPQIRAALLAAEALESELLGDGICAVLTPSGEVEHGSAAFRVWYDSQVADRLTHLVADVESRGEVKTQVLFRGEILHFSRLDGVRGVRYMMTAEGAESIRIKPERMLTERQREIVEFIVADATSREIAQELEISYHTVRTHMKNIYRRLDVASKIELINLLKDE